MPIVQFEEQRSSRMCDGTKFSIQEDKWFKQKPDTKLNKENADPRTSPSQLSFQLMEKELKKSIEGKHQKHKADASKGAQFQSHQTAKLGSFSYMVLALSINPQPS